MLRDDGGVFILGLERYAELEALLAALRDGGHRASTSWRSQETDLEQVFLQIMGGEAATRRAESRADDADVAGAGWLTLLYKELLRFWKVRFQTIARAGADVAPVPAHLLARARSRACPCSTAA